MGWDLLDAPRVKSCGSSSAFCPALAAWLQRHGLKKGDFKIRLHGKKLNGDFALIHMRSRRPGTKGTEWTGVRNFTARKHLMAMKKGETYGCPNDDCACQIQVTRSSSATRTTDNPRCCCGEARPTRPLSRA